MGIFTIFLGISCDSFELVVDMERLNIYVVLLIILSDWGLSI